MALRDAVLQEVAHDEQMTIWTGEVLGSLSVAGYMAEDMAYDEVLDAHRLVASEIRSILGHAVDVLVEAAKNQGHEKERAMKGDGETWAEHNKLVLDQLDEAIAIRETGEDAYKRWPLDLLRKLRVRLITMTDFLDHE